MLVFQLTCLLASGIPPKAPTSHYLSPALQNGNTFCLGLDQGPGRYYAKPYLVSMGP